MKKQCIRIGVFLLLISMSVSVASANQTTQLIYPINIHYWHGTYYITDRGAESVFSFQHNSLTTLYHSDDNTIIDMPMGVTDDNLNSVVIADVGVGGLSKINIHTKLITQFNPPKNQPSYGPRLIAKYLNGYVFTHNGNKTIIQVSPDGKQRGILQGVFDSPYGITPFTDEMDNPTFIVADGEQGKIALVSQNKPSSLISLCQGQPLKMPFGIVLLNNKIYFDDAALHALYSINIQTHQCKKVSNHFVLPMGMTTNGVSIVIVDLGARALVEYNPNKNSLKKIYSEHAPIPTLIQPWDFYVTNQAVYLTDYKRGAVLKVSKKTRAISVISSPNHGTGAPFLTEYAITHGDKNRIFVSDASHDVIVAIDPKTGNRTLFSDSFENRGAGFSDPTHMIFDKGNLYVADWSNSAVMKVDPNGNRSTVATLKSKPFDITNVTDHAVYVTQPISKQISKVNLLTGKSTPLSLQRCNNIKNPISLTLFNKDTLYFTDATTQTVNKINLKNGACKLVALIPTTGKEQAWTIKRYDADRVLVNVFNGNKIYLVNVENGVVKNFLAH